MANFKLGKLIFLLLSKSQLCDFFAFDILPKLSIVYSTPLLILHRRYDSICIRYKSTSPFSHRFERNCNKRFLDLHLRLAEEWQQDQKKYADVNKQ